MDHCAEELAAVAHNDAELLLNTGVSDRQVKHLLDRANAMTRKIAGDRGYVWAAIGIDSTPCRMGCSFCSQAGKWNAYTGTAPLSTEAIVHTAGCLAAGGADFVVLRTTQFYGFERLLDLGKRVRERIGDDRHLVVNTGEMEVEAVKALKDAGFSMAYHVVRLREGIDTGHTVAMRLRTIDAVLAGGLELQYLIEPLGPEHRADEILAEARRARSIGASGTGVMARVPVMGTPLARFGQVSEAYLGRVAAVARLEYPDGGKYLCVHPPSPSTLRCASNTIIVEQAANPRDTVSSPGPWRGFDLATARETLRAAGLTVRPAKEPCRASCPVP